jgi:hypothetical protein
MGGANNELGQLVMAAYPGPGLCPVATFAGIVEALIIQFPFGGLADSRFVAGMGRVENAITQAVEKTAAVRFNHHHVDPVML